MGLFKVVHGDLFGDVFVIGPELIIKIEIFDRRPSSQAVKNLSSKNKTLWRSLSQQKKKVHVKDENGATGGPTGQSVDTDR